MLAAVTLVTVILMRILFKNSIFKRIGLIWVITIILNSINTNARHTFESYPQSIALPVGIIVLGLGIALASRYFTGPLKDMIKSISTLSRGNLNTNVKDKYRKRKDEIGKLAKSIDNLSQTFSNMLSQIKNGSEKLYKAGNNLQNITNKLNDSAGNQSGKVVEISSVIKELTANIRQNTEYSKTAKKLSQNRKKQ